jgi:hypothetical protein
MKRKKIRVTKSVKPIPSKNGSRRGAPALPQQRTYSVPDTRLEKPAFTVRQVRKGDEVHYEVSGDLSAPVPPIRDSKYLSQQQCIEIYRWMVLNRKMETALENLYKQGKVVGGVYFGLGQEACSCASAYALGKDDWIAPMIRNQGSLLVRGFEPRDMMMQYMATAGSPTKGRDGTSHFGDIYKRNVVSPISMLGDLIPVLAGVALGARLQGKNVAVMTYIGDGGMSTGAIHKEYPLMGMTGRPSVVHFAGVTQWTYSGKQLNGIRLVQIHPDTAQKANIQNGDTVIVETPRGSVRGDIRKSRLARPRGILGELPDRAGRIRIVSARDEQRGFPVRQITEHRRLFGVHELLVSRRLAARAGRSADARYDAGQRVAQTRGRNRSRQANEHYAGRRARCCESERTQHHAAARSG